MTMNAEHTATCTKDLADGAWRGAEFANIGELLTPRRGPASRARSRRLTRRSAARAGGRSCRRNGLETTETPNATSQPGR
jgi:hypothetical protein